MGQVVEKKNQCMPDIANIITSLSTDEDTKAKRGQWTGLWSYTQSWNTDPGLALSEVCSITSPHTVTDSKLVRPKSVLDGGDGMCKGPEAKEELWV